MQITNTGTISAKAVDQELPQGGRLLADHRKRRREKFRQNDQIDRNILLPRLTDLMGSALAQKQQIAFL